MRFDLNGTEVYASTGGRAHKDGQPWLIFLHGAGSSHLVWNQQTRALAYDDYNVLALDFPGHNLSTGTALIDVDAQAQWVVQVMDHLNIEKATVIGHSQGGLVGLKLTDIAGDRIEKAVFVATAAAIPVNDMLISTAETKEDLAKASMMAWAHGPDAHHHENSVPGFSNIGVGLRVMDLNPEGSLPTDLKACAQFDGGLDLAAKVSCPTMCVLASRDKMTPLKFGMQLADALPNNVLHVEDCGHSLPVENPIELNAHLRAFLNQ